MRAARVESGSASVIPTITGNEYFAGWLAGRSMMTPLASISSMCELTSTKATGVRSRTTIFSRLGSRRITDADCTQGICSSCFLRCSSGTKKMLRSMSLAITSRTCERLTLSVPEMAMLSLESRRKRQDWVA